MPQRRNPIDGTDLITEVRLEVDVAADTYKLNARGEVNYFVKSGDWSSFEEDFATSAAYYGTGAWRMNFVEDIVAQIAVSDGNVAVEWQGVEGVNYSVLEALSLSDPEWEVIRGPWPETWFEFPVAPGEARFYRIGQE